MPEALLAIFRAAAVLATVAAAPAAAAPASKPATTAAAPASAPSAPAAAKPLRILINPETQWGWARDSTGDSALARKNRSRRAQLGYYRTLGFTHITYGLDPIQFSHYHKVEGKWTFDRIGGAVADSSLATAKREAEARGFQVIPQLPCLSAMSPVIFWLDSTVSEFPGRAAFKRFTSANGLRDDYKGLNFVAAVGPNPAADQVFEIQLHIIKRGWRNDPAKAPAYIHIGHDELGYDSICFIKGGRNRANPKTRSELVAEEINLRVSQITRILGDSVKIILYGDSFLPTDLGERFGMAGKAGTGENGVLHILNQRYHLQNRIIIMPWNYILADGDTHYWSGLKYDKRKIVALLDRLGFGYIPGTGEQGGAGDPTLNRLAPPFALGMPEKTAACLREWVSATRAHPRLLRGYAHQVFEPFDYCSPAGLCAGFSAPLLAYAAWGPGASAAAAGAPLPKSVFDGVKYRRSRWELRWQAGTHYPAP
jgi:hypothetical protein